MPNATKQARKELRGDAKSQGLSGGRKKRFVRQGLRAGGRAVAASQGPYNTGGGGLVRNEEGDKQSVFYDPSRPSKRAKKSQKRDFKGQGLRGPALKGAMKGWKQDAQSRLPYPGAKGTVPIPKELQGLVDPRKWQHALLVGKEPFAPFNRMAGAEGMKELFGYNKAGDALEEGVLGEYEAGVTPDLLHNNRAAYDFYDQYARGDSGRGASPDVDMRHDQAATLGELGTYARERLQGGGGLTGDEENAIRGRGMDALGGAYKQANRNQMTNMAQAGIDPRSGVGRDNALKLEKMRQTGRTGVERDVTLRDLARKRETETLARGTAGLEEQARLGDVSADLRRRGQYEAMLGTAAPLSEMGRRFDVGTNVNRRNYQEATLGQLAQARQGEYRYGLDYAEGGRQAAKSRKAWQEASEAMKPSKGEIWANVISGAAGGFGG